KSLADFWGRRWNRSFTTLANDLIFAPLAHRIRPIGATAAVFLISGLVHDLVISIPARGGYGRATIYFLIQLAALLLERSRFLRSIGFGLVSLLCPTSLASGAPLARAVCAFIALFWGLRLMIQFFLFDARPYLTNLGLKLGYHGLTVVFTYFALTYALAAVMPVR